MAEMMHSGTKHQQLRPQGIPTVLERVSMLNDDPLFVGALAETVETHAAPWLGGSVEAA